MLRTTYCVKDDILCQGQRAVLRTMYCVKNHAVLRTMYCVKEH